MSESGKILYFDMPRVSPDAPASESTAELPLDPKDALASLVESVEDCGQDPATQLFGYLITEDPTYLPDEGQARTLARRVGRDKLLRALIDAYLANQHATDGEA